MPAIKPLLIRRVLGFALLCCGIPAFAYPPAPSHLIYGLVRDQYGTPLSNPNAQVILQTSSGVSLATTIIPNLAIGVNYELRVPMDAGLTSDTYKSNALESATSFSMLVVIGSTTNAPLQVAGDFSQLGQPAQMTRIDLTLGVDSNHDGIPDAWETAFLNAIGSNLTLADLNAGLDVAHDGRTLQQEYLLGTYPFDPQDPFAVRIVSLNSGAPILEFPTMTGRSYTVFGSPDLQQWSPLPFRLVADGSGGSIHTNFTASVIDKIQVQVVPPPSSTRAQFFKVQLQ
jgi:hypothetical protein